MATGELKVEWVKVNFLKIKILAKNQQKWPGWGRYLSKKFKVSVFKPLWVSHIIYIPGEKIGHRVVHTSPGPPVLSCLFWRYLFKSKSIYGTVSLSILLWKCTLRSLSVSSANLVLRFLIVITYYSSRASLPHVRPSEIHSPNINCVCNSS